MSCTQKVRGSLNPLILGSANATTLTHEFLSTPLTIRLDSKTLTLNSLSSKPSILSSMSPNCLTLHLLNCKPLALYCMDIIPQTLDILTANPSIFVRVNWKQSVWLLSFNPLTFCSLKTGRLTLGPLGANPLILGPLNDNSLTVIPLRANPLPSGVQGANKS